jgi:hypothetical protein
MATTSSSLTTTANSLGQAVSEKLSRENYILWKAQVLAVVRGARLKGYLEGMAPAPAKNVQVKLPDKTLRWRTTQPTQLGMRRTNKSSVSC